MHNKIIHTHRYQLFESHPNTNMSCSSTQHHCHIKAVVELLQLYAELLGFLVIMPIISLLNTQVYEMYKLIA